MTDENWRNILAKHPDSGGTTLAQHLKDVADAAVIIARDCGMDEDIARAGALLHDIGKVSPQFQKTLKPGYVRKPGYVWRHEIASLFFISLVPEEWRDAVIDMIAGHHKSVKNDVGGKGLIDLEDYDEDTLDNHIKGFEKWSKTALQLLRHLDMDVHPISYDEAVGNYQYAVDYCRKKGCGCSRWKGLLMAADHLASAADKEYRDIEAHMFIKPDLSFYNRKSTLYPLSLISSDDKRRHTLVTAPTGAGKTDFLLRRCRGRVFYTLPFQASINAMYDRISKDLSDTDAVVTLLHATSEIKLEDGRLQEQIMQHHIGASVKVMTPHQMASIVFGIKGYEAMAADLRGCDVILDEIHTYSDVMQAVVCRIIEILVTLGCRVHVGTATMPSVLYDRILRLLGGTDCVYEVKLPDKVLDTFNRHIIHRCDDFESVMPVIGEALANKQKILIVCNRVARAQECYENMRELYPDADHMLIHSRFMRGSRSRLERELKERFNTMTEACIVVSTQVVEVSLDISFDLMVTECAPIDAMIQRFGRINRKRTEETIGRLKHIYVLKPMENEKDTLPYKPDVLKSSYEVLPDNDVMEESSMQSLIDKVYPDLDFRDIDYSGAVFVDGEWQLKELCHRSKSALLDVLEFNSVVCVRQSDEEAYVMSGRMDAMELEIPASYHSIVHRGLKQLDVKSRPFVIPDEVYDDETGLDVNRFNKIERNNFEIL